MRRVKNELISKVYKTLAYYNKKGLIAIRSIYGAFFPITITRPIFIVGCSRSGTTLVYKTFSEASELGTLQKETHNFWASLQPVSVRNWDSHRIPEELANKTDKKNVALYFFEQTGKFRFVDKNNQNGLSIKYLHRLFPDASFVYVKRSPGDNLHSLIEGWGRANEFATWSDKLPEKISIDNGRYAQWCFFLSEGWRDYISASIEEVCAFQYKSMNEAILEAKNVIPESQWVEVFYEDLVKDPVNSFRDIFRKCDLSFGTGVETHCQNVLQKPYNTFSEIRLDKWLDGQNSDKIKRILPLVKDIAKKMGYVL